MINFLYAINIQIFFKLLFNYFQYHTDIYMNKKAFHYPLSPHTSNSTYMNISMNGSLIIRIPYL